MPLVHSTASSLPATARRPRRTGFAHALGAAGVHVDTPATVLSDGDAGLWRLQRETLPNGRARLVACRRAFRACAADGTWSWRRCADADLADKAVGRLECLMRQLTGYKPRRLASSPVATPTP